MLKADTDPNEKASAYRGFCKVAPNSFDAVRNNYPFICSCFIEFKNPPADLEGSFKEILQAYKQRVLNQGNQH